MLGIGISGAVAALFQERERKSRGKNKPREYHDGPIDMCHEVMINLRNDCACSGIWNFGFEKLKNKALFSPTIILGQSIHEWTK